MLTHQNGPGKQKLAGYLKVNFNQKAENERVLAYTDRINEDMKMQSFKPSAIELENLLVGELEYLNYGCSACHKFGEILLISSRLVNKHGRHDTGST